MAQQTSFILLADDDTEDQEILIDAFSEAGAGVQVKSVFNGEKAVSFLENCDDAQLPRLVILDYKMPLLNAEDVLTALYNNPRYNNIPKVVWSTSRQPEHKEKCLAKGAQRYFVKPASSSEIKTIAKEMLKIAGYLKA